ncbi:hypothetical protein [Erythrobacter sp. AP23]|uniref:hypothetical protein n=1 Tax=Erythrobacter sp. AP23 TaxID=499656 RepID=UPI00076D3A88|nr:hypothetical protein [Erythrobacter sp. AP23]KWV94158.1 hypothetical protein ASS64_10000 [Erythrobacter sp. AP23]
MTNFHRSLVLGCSALALASCGADEIVSPGTGGNITINNTNTPAPTPTPTPTPTSTLVTPAAGCPTISDPVGLTDTGTISGPTGTYRVCELPERFTASSTLPFINGLLYRINERVDVGTDGGPADTGADTDVELTIEPGVILFSSGSGWMNVNRGNTIQAVGTAARPIIFTSRDNVQGLNTVNSSGQWGGLVLSGRAPVTDCIAPGATPGTVACERQVEGAAQPALFGGATAGDDSGNLDYVQIRYSGFVLSGDNELQALTTGGVGSGTSISNIMSYNSSDDGVEFFGGQFDVRNLIVVGAEDDSLDTDTGVKSNMQNVIVVQRPGVGDTIIEADSNNGLEEQTPRQKTQISNATFIHNGAEQDQAIRIRGGADFAIVNSVLIDRTGGTPCLRLDLPETIRAAGAGPDEDGPPVFESFVMDCDVDFRDGSGGVTAAQTQAIYDGGSNNDAGFTNTLTMTFVNGANENGVAVFDPTSLDAFFTLPTNIGAAYPGNDTWIQGWTCNSATVTFDAAVSDCSSLPVY